MITISGLTPHQKDMLDILWELPDLDAVQAWQDTLDPADLQLSKQLVSLLVIETIDVMSEKEPTTQAQSYLKKFRL